MRVEVPEGFRIEREERQDFLREPRGAVRAVAFTVIETEFEHAPVTTAEARFDSRDGEWTVHPGSSTSRIPPAEARARAAALLMAADECERRNG